VEQYVQLYAISPPANHSKKGLSVKHLKELSFGILFLAAVTAFAEDSAQVTETAVTQETPAPSPQTAPAEIPAPTLAPTPAPTPKPTPKATPQPYAYDEEKEELFPPTGDVVEFDDAHPLPGTPYPDGSGQFPLDDTKYMLKPYVAAQAGYAGIAGNKGYDHGAGVSVMVFLDMGRAGIVARGQAAGGEGGLFGYFQGDLKYRYRFPFTEKDIVWGAIGTDVSGRIAKNENMPGYFAIQPVTAFGKLFFFKNQCVLHVFAKAGVSAYDSRTQGSQKFFGSDASLRPMLGAESLFHCGSIRITGDLQRIFSFGDGGTTDKASLEYSQTFPIKTEGSKLELGFFGRADGERWGAVSGIDASDPRANARYNAAVFGGLELRFDLGGGVTRQQ